MNTVGGMETPEGRLSGVVETVVDGSNEHDAATVAQQAQAADGDAGAEMELLLSLGWVRPEAGDRQVEAVAHSDLLLLRNALAEYDADELLPTVTLSELVLRHSRAAT